MERSAIRGSIQAARSVPDYAALHPGYSNTEQTMPSAHGTFYWNERTTRDIEAIKKFYADTLGWSYDAMPLPGGETYWLANIGGTPVGGISDISSPDFKDVPEGWMSYIAVDDVDARVKKATAAGAKVMKPAFDVPGVGRIAILLEPGGAGVGWITPAQ
jgi:hypothetical protein